MEVYRCCGDRELKLYKEGIVFNKGFGIGDNTFKYQRGVPYIHFFYFAESMYHYKKHRPSEYTKHYVQYDIPEEVLNNHLGYGYYEAVIPGYYVPVPEFAIPHNEFKMEYIKEVFESELEKYARTNEWEAYKENIPHKYFANYETGAFEVGFNEDSITNVTLDKVLTLTKKN